jgi:Fur family peroxide stress response transcriptional regulator
MKRVKGKSSSVTFKDICADKGLKVTPQRTLIYKELMTANDHPSADIIYTRVKEQLPNISFDTVYRTLLTFVEHSIIRLVEGYGDKKRFEPIIESHHHFHCIKCHTIIDFSNEDYNQIDVPKEVSDQCTVFNTRVVLEGVCSKCKKK